jgi:uroporphyrinogen-III synthase
MVTLANIVVTRPVWGDGKDPLVEVLRGQAKKYWVNVHHSPMQTLRLAGDAAQRAMLRELDDFCELRDPRPVYFCCTSSAGIESIPRMDPLIDACIARRSRFRYAAIDDDTAYDLADMLLREGIAPVKKEQILVPSAPGSIESLVAAIVEKAEPGTLVVLVEAADDRMLGQKLFSAGLRIIRLPVYARSSVALIDLPQDEAPWWMFVSESSSVKPVIDGLVRQRIAPESVRWIGLSPTVGKTVQRYLPEAIWARVLDLRPESILGKVARHE